MTEKKNATPNAIIFIVGTPNSDTTAQRETKKKAYRIHCTAAKYYRAQNDEQYRNENLRYSSIHSLSHTFTRVDRPTRLTHALDSYQKKKYVLINESIDKYTNYTGKRWRAGKRIAEKYEREPRQLAAKTCKYSILLFIRVSFFFLETSRAKINNARTRGRWLLLGTMGTCMEEE